MNEADSDPRPALPVDFDLSQFYQVFFEEAGETLAAMENMLIAFDVAAPAETDLHAIFRAAHSIKGGAAAFGFQDVAELTHELETLLDRVRKNELAMTAAMVDVLLEASDVLKDQLAGHQGGGESKPGDLSGLLLSLRALASGKAGDGGKPVEGMRVFDMVIGPLQDASLFEGIVGLFSEIQGLGSITPIEGADGAPGEGMRGFRVATTTPEEDLCELFSFHVSRDQVRFHPAVPSPTAGAHAQEMRGDRSPVDTPSSATTVGGAPEPDALPIVAAASGATAAESRLKPRGERPSTGGADASTIRVAVEKVDQLINLVGELVITQAMLTNRGHAMDPVVHEGLLSRLADLERNTRSLQEAVMGIRMIPMAVVFNRFPRMLRGLATKLGKDLELKTSGEATKLDKGLIESITDPLTHLIRNAVDHGIEMPDKRVAAGKPARGTISLSAAHQGGSIVIEVRDDGAGLDRRKILAKARQQGLEVHDGLADEEVWQLIWAPGFSTAEEVTDVSGRGVGLDVVLKNITALGGVVELDSIAGHGTRISVRLPLTLAIMDGMSVGVNGEIFIIPLSNVIESLQVKETMLRTVVGQGRVVEGRTGYLAVLALHDVFKSAAPNTATPGKILVIVEYDGAQAALLVDELIGQQQVVVKNLEANYRKVPGISGATIMGDGRIALILDVAHVVAAGNRTGTAPANQLKH